MGARARVQRRRRNKQSCQCGLTNSIPTAIMLVTKVCVVGLVPAAGSTTKSRNPPRGAAAVASAPLQPALTHVLPGARFYLHAQSQVAGH